MRHFFATQDELHRFAMEALARRIAERVQTTLDDILGEGPITAEAARRASLAALELLVPTTDETHDLFAAHVQFIATAAVRPALAPTAVQIADQMHAFIDRLEEAP